MKNMQHLKDKINWIKKNEDINYTGESEDFREGIIEGLEYALQYIERDKAIEKTDQKASLE